jgi:hypothetical protein
MMHGFYDRIRKMAMNLFLFNAARLGDGSHLAVPWREMVHTVPRRAADSRPDGRRAPSLKGMS